MTPAVRVATYPPVDPAGLPAIIDAVKHLHGCAATFVESVSVHETLPDGRVVWDGEVQVLDLIVRPKAKRAYAWSYATTGKKRFFMAVLGLGPVVDTRPAEFRDQARSKRSRFITFVHAATKSRTNLSCASELP